MGIIDHISDNFSVGRIRKSKHKPMQTVEIFVKIDCDGCERRLTDVVSSIKGAQSWDVDRKQHKITVTGYVEPKKVLEKVKSTGKRAQLWPFVKHDLVYYPYAAQAYDKKAPSGHVRNVAQAFPTENTPYDKYSTLFSDENVNGCIVM